MVQRIRNFGQDHPSGLSKWMTAELGVGLGAVERSNLTPGLEVGPGMSWRISLPSGRWDTPAGESSVPRRMRSVATMTMPPYPVLNAKSRAVKSTQTSTHDWLVDVGGGPVRVREENPLVVIESMTFLNSSIRVENEEVVLMPQPATVTGIDTRNATRVADPVPPPECGEEDRQQISALDTIPEAIEDNTYEETPPEIIPRPPEVVRPAAEPPLEGIEVVLPDPDPACPMCGVLVGKVGMLGKHFASRHPKVPIRYKCRKCGRLNANSHSISCHVPKCKGVAEVGPKSGLEFICELCGDGFGTAVGLTQHKRHNHPRERNQERIEQAIRAKAGVKGSKLWSVEEVEALKELEVKYADRAHSNKLIADELGSGKTAEQVRNKRRCLANALARDGPDNAVEGVQSEPPGPAAPTVPPSPPNLVASRLREALVREGDTGGENEIRAIASLIRDVDQDPDLIESAASSLINQLGRTGAPSRAAERREDRAQKGWERRLSQKRKDYRLHQRLYTRDPSRLAALVLDGAESLECAIPIDQLYEAFRERWEVVEPFHGLGNFRSAQMADNGEFICPILAGEVRENLIRMKNGSAPGPDGISKRALLDWDRSGEQLGRLYTTWLVHGVIPRAVKECRTRLLPKSRDADKVREVSGWRPVTIGSLILRLFSRIMTMRLTRACPMNPRQRGFLSDSSGCADNLMILNGLIRRSRSEEISLAVVFVDFAKAFDSISHEHILCALEQRQLDRHVIELIRNSYVDCVTRVGNGGERTPPINMKVGVKQGDPMSPLLFNLAMDPLIQALEDTGSGLVWEGKAITTLAFADDLVLLSSSDEGMRRNLEVLESFCQLTGLKVQPSKCHGFSIHKGVVNGGQTWAIGGATIPLVEPGMTVRYLGVDVGPWQGIVAPDLVPKLQEWLVRIKKAPLKPSQRVRVLNSFALPRLIYQADMCNIPVTTLTTLDGMARSAIKSWLHLPLSTCNGLLYSRNCDGGLGIVRLAEAIPAIQAKRIFRLSRSTDDWTRHVTTRTVAESEWQRLWCRVGKNPDETPRLVMENGSDATEGSLVLRDWRQDENLGWEALQVQGVGVRQFRGDRLSNSWLSDPARVGFRQRHFIAGLSLRAGVYPTREFLSRGRNKEGAACRRCPARLESCSHILGQCPSVKGSRVHRHHKIRDLLAIEAERVGWTVTKEFRVDTPEGGLRIPDLVCKKDTAVLVIDVTVRYEMDNETLRQAAREKVDHYNPVAPQILAMMEGSSIKVMGFPVGARGKWPRESTDVLVEIGLTVGRRKYFAGLVSRRALLYSLDILRDFMVGATVWQPP